MNKFYINIIILLFPVLSFANDNCRAEVLRDIPETNSFEYGRSAKQGEILIAVTQLIISNTEQEAFICTHGGGCFLAKKDNVSYIKNINCKANKNNPDTRYNSQATLFNIE